MFTSLFPTPFLLVLKILFAFMIITEHTDTVFISMPTTSQRYFFWVVLAILEPRIFYTKLLLPFLLYILLDIVLNFIFQFITQFYSTVSTVCSSLLKIVT